MLAAIRERRVIRIVLQHVGVYAALVPLAAIFSAPLIWMVSTSLKPDVQMSAWPPVWIPRPIQWENYVEAWTSAPFTRYLLNTLLYAVSATIGQLLSASLVAYGFARLRAPGRDFLFGLVLATMMLPAVVTMIPRYAIFRVLGWLNSYKPLIVPAFFGGGAFFIFLLRQFFMTIPASLFDSAKIDGAGEFRSYWQVMLPLSKPALSTVTIYAFMQHWNNFIGPLLYVDSPDKYPLTLGIRRFMTERGTEFQQMMAVSFVMTLPVIAAFFLFQQYFVQGVVMSGIKA